MSFEYQPLYQTRLYYEPNGTEVFKFPEGNIFSAMDLLLRTEIDVASGGAANAPDFQVANLIESITLVRDNNKIIWSLSGQALAAMFTYDRESGVAAANNSAMAGSNASNVQGQHFMHCPFYPLDAAKKSDFAVDTRFSKYELKIKWRDFTQPGVFFGTHTGAVSGTDSENYLDIELHRLALIPNRADGTPDALTNVSPLVVGYREERIDVTANNTEFAIELADNEEFRNIVLYTTHVANTLQEVGENDIIQNYLTLKDTNQRIKQSRRVDMLREKTSQKWGMGSSLPNGIYDLELLFDGKLMDVIKSTPTQRLKLIMDVAKQSNATYIRPIYVTQEQQVV